MNISLKTRGAFPFDDSSLINMVRVDAKRGIDKWFAVVPLRVISQWLQRDAVQVVRQCAAMDGKPLPEKLIERILELEETAMGFSALGQTLKFVWKLEVSSDSDTLSLGLRGDGWERYEQIKL